MGAGFPLGIAEAPMIMLERMRAVVNFMMSR